MKLTHPTNEELNAAFAEKIVGIKWHRPTEEEMRSGSYYSYWPDFTRSADAVLPWLGKKQVWECIWNDNPYTGKRGCSVLVADSFTEDLKEPKGRSGWVNADTFPLAAVIALLIAHGVEVEFP